jgi:hypothetical protein
MSKKCDGCVEGSPCCDECNRLRLSNHRLRGWLRYIDEQYESERERELGQFIRNALAGKTPPKGGRR